MKRAIGLIAATLLTTSLYSQDYSSSSSSTSNPDSTPDYQSRQSEAGAPANSESSSSSSAGYDRAPGLSGGNSSTGQSNGANVGSASEQEQSLTTRDSDLSGSEYRGTVQTEPERSFNSELNETPRPLGGGETADGAFHDPASPVREGSQSEGWSSSGTFSGAGPGSVSGSASSSSTSDSLVPTPTESSSSFSADVSNNSALSNRDQELSNRGLEPDSDQLSRTDAFSNRVEGDIDNDETMIFEDWTVITPDAQSNVGAPAESEVGVSSSADNSSQDQFKSSVNGSSSGDSYSEELYQRVQRDWSARTGTTDVPATPLMDKSLEELGNIQYDDSVTRPDVGAPGSSVSGSGKSEDAECDEHKGSAPDYQKGDESSSKYHINRGDDEKYHINREGSGDQSNADTRAPGEYGDRPERSSDYDDGHLSGNNAAGASGSSESSSSKSSDESSRSTDGALTQPDL